VPELVPIPPELPVDVPPELLLALAPELLVASALDPPPSSGPTVPSTPDAEESRSEAHGHASHVDEAGLQTCVPDVPSLH
jgi:hypothetical protein